MSRHGVKESINVRLSMQDVGRLLSFRKELKVCDGWEGSTEPTYTCCLADPSTTRPDYYS